MNHAKTAGNQARQAAQHAEKQPQVHRADEQVVEPEPEVRDAVLRVAYPSIEPPHGHAAPVKPHQHLDVEIHSRAGPLLVQQPDQLGDRVDPETAHRVADVERKGVEPDEDVGQVAAVEPGSRHVRAEDRPAADHGPGLLPAGCQEPGQVADVMLAIGVELQRVGEALPGRGAKPHSDGATLAEVARQAQDLDARIRGRQGIERAGTGRPGAVVDQDAGQPVTPDGGHDGPDGALMVEHGYQHAGFRHPGDP